MLWSVWEGSTPRELAWQAVQPAVSTVSRLLGQQQQQQQQQGGASAASNGGVAATCCKAGSKRAGAAQLKHALRQAQQTDGPAFWRSQLLNTAGALVQYGGLLSAVTSAMSPQGPGCCDHNGRERVANLLTSLPYAWIGVHGIRNRRSARGRAWGVSMLGVGAGSLTFHASHGRWRSLGRKVDYWMISVASAMLTRAIYPNQPTALTVASLLATPFRPFMISAMHTTALEVSFLQRAFRDPALRPAQRLHSAAALAGMALFFLEDSVPHIPFVHCTWHCTSAAATGAIHALLDDVEKDGARVGGKGGAALAAAALLLPPHSGAAGPDALGAGAAAAAAGARELVVAPLSV